MFVSLSINVYNIKSNFTFIHYSFQQVIASFLLLSFLEAFFCDWLLLLLENCLNSSNLCCWRRLLILNVKIKCLCLIWIKSIKQLQIKKQITNVNPVPGACCQFLLSSSQPPTWTKVTDCFFQLKLALPVVSKGYSRRWHFVKLWVITLFGLNTLQQRNNWFNLKNSY